MNELEIIKERAERIYHNLPKQPIYDPEEHIDHEDDFDDDKGWELNLWKVYDHHIYLIKKCVRDVTKFLPEWDFQEDFNELDKEVKKSRYPYLGDIFSKFRPLLIRIIETTEMSVRQTEFTTELNKLEAIYDVENNELENEIINTAEEIAISIKNDCLNSAVIMCRRALELASKNRCEKDGISMKEGLTLAKILDKIGISNDDKMEFEKYLKNDANDVVHGLPRLTKEQAIGFFYFTLSSLKKLQILL